MQRCSHEPSFNGDVIPMKTTSCLFLQMHIIEHEFTTNFERVRQHGTCGVSAALYGDLRLRHSGLVRPATLESYRKKAQLSTTFE